MTAGNVYLNGRTVPAEQAAVSVYDAAFLHGASTFTTMLAHNGRVFRLDRQLARLLETVQLLELRIGATAESLIAGTYELLKANALQAARMRITLTPGSIRGGEPTILITADPMPEYPREWYEEGVAVSLSPYRQIPGDPTYGFKTGCYFTRMLARQDAAKKGAEEALWFTPQGLLAEACFNNVFLVRAGKVATPPLATPVLPGIVRGAATELCGPLGIPCDDQTPLTVHDMLAADEAFLTGSTSGIRPIIRIERHAVGGGKPGEVTKRLTAAYRELLEKECPASEE
jgi:branched-chain amino acid aminotransferase